MYDMKNLKKFPKLGELDRACFLEGHAQLAVVRPAHEEHNVIHAEVRRDLSGVAKADLDVPFARLLLHDLQDLYAHLARDFERRA